MEFERPYKREWVVVMKDEYMINDDTLELIKDADTIVVNFPVPQDTQFISWVKFNQYMINYIYQIENSLDILGTKDMPYTITRGNDGGYYTADDVSELRVGNDVIYNNSNEHIASIKGIAFDYIINRMESPTGKVVIIPSDSGNEYKFYISEYKYYYVRPSEE